MYLISIIPPPLQSDLHWTFCGMGQVYIILLSPFLAWHYIILHLTRSSFCIFWSFVYTCICYNSYCKISDKSHTSTLWCFCPNTRSSSTRTVVRRISVLSSSNTCVSDRYWEIYSIITILPVQNIGYTSGYEIGMAQSALRCSPAVCTLRWQTGMLVLYGVWLSI